MPGFAGNERGADPETYPARESDYRICLASGRAAEHFKSGRNLSAQDQVKGQQPMLGVGGQKLFIFTALQPGEVWIHVKHSRAWEQNPIDEWRCRVRVS